MSVTVFVQHAKCVRRIILSSVACPVLPYFFTLSYKRYDFLNMILEHKMCVLIFSTNLSETFLVLRGIQRDIIINVQRYSCKVSVILARF